MDTCNYSFSVFVSCIYQIDFDNFDKHDKKLKDWRLPKETDWSEVRMRFTDEKPDLMNYFNVPRFDVPELMRSAEDGKKYRDVWYNVSRIIELRYFILFNPDWEFLLRRLLVWNTLSDTMSKWETPVS